MSDDRISREEIERRLAVCRRASTGWASGLEVWDHPLTSSPPEAETPDPFSKEPPKHEFAVVRNAICGAVFVQHYPHWEDHKRDLGFILDSRNHRESELRALLSARARVEKLEAKVERYRKALADVVDELCGPRAEIGYDIPDITLRRMQESARNIMVEHGIDPEELK